MAKHYKYVSKRNEDVKRVRKEIETILREVQNEVRDKFTFQYKFVGSYSRNMITYDPKSNIGFDLDINIIPNDDDENFNAKEIKHTLIRAINKFAKKYGYSYVEDSTRVITIKVKDTKHSKIKHSVDFAIVHDYVDNGSDCQEYIHFNKKAKTYSWQEQGDDFYDLRKKIKWLKDEGLWPEVREMYLNLKNNNHIESKKSRSLFAEAVNNLYNSY